MNNQSLLNRQGRYRVEYYAWRHLPYATFQQLNALLTLVETLNRIPEDVTEAHVARMKLAFFQSDIAQFNTNQAKHPEVQALSGLLDLSPFDSLCTALETEIDRVQSIDENDFNRYCRRKRGSVLLLCAQLLKKAPLTEAEQSSVNDLGIFIERMHLLQIRDSHPEKLHLFSLKDFSQEEYIDNTRHFFNKASTLGVLAPLYDAQFKQIDSPLSPLKLLALSLFSRLKGY